MSLLNTAIEQLIKLFLISIASLLLNLLLELVNVLHILSLFLVLLTLLIGLNCLVELLIFKSLFALFKVLDFDLLFD